MCQHSIRRQSFIFRVFKLSPAMDTEKMVGIAKSLTIKGNCELSVFSDTWFGVNEFFSS